MGKDVCLEECTVNFQKAEMSSTMNLSTIKTVCVGQQVTIKAKVASLHQPKHIKTKNLRLQESTLVDPHGTVRLR